MHIFVNAAGERLDVALLRALHEAGHEISRAQLQRSFRSGAVCVHGQPQKAARVIDGDMDVEVTLLEPEPLRAEPEDLPLHVVYEDKAVLVVDKPAPMVVHPSAGHAHGTLVSAVLHHVQGTPAALPTLPQNQGDEPEVANTRPGVVHRLDRGTSGVMVFAKTSVALTSLAAQFQAHSIERVYLGIVRGRPGWTARTLDTQHGRDPTHRLRFSPQTGTRRAITNMSVQARVKEASLVQFTLRTGRTHQIRMHARHVGHPILGDLTYGTRLGLPDIDNAFDAMQRHALHAAVLGFRHPQTGASMRFESPFPAELMRVWEQLVAMSTSSS